ncbi:4Fe-4S binding protein [candidate division KSB1 bacterium]|nr:4Fe-4S binding protein [candidate division KSB1 bacterium]
MFQVNQEKCTGCEICISECPMRAITMVNGKAQIDSDQCTECGQCVTFCPQGAIEEDVRVRPDTTPAPGPMFSGFRPGQGRGLGRGMGRGQGRGPRDGRGRGKGGGGRR